MTAPQASTHNEHTEHIEKLPVRRVGSISSGITLIGFGIMLLCAQFIRGVDIEALLKLAPAMLVVLGIEIIFASFKSDKYIIKYDFASMIMCFCVVMFAIFATCGTMYYMQ